MIKPKKISDLKIGDIIKHYYTSLKINDSYLIGLCVENPKVRDRGLRIEVRLLIISDKDANVQIEYSPGFITFPWTIESESRWEILG